MEYCKEDLNTQVFVVIDNPKYLGKTCPCCGRKFLHEEQEYLIVNGVFDKIYSDGDDIYYYAEIMNPVTDTLEDVIISRRFILMNDNYPLKDHSIFDLEWSFDEGPRAFKTMEEAEAWVKEFSK